MRENAPDIDPREVVPDVDDEMVLAAPDVEPHGTNPKPSVVEKKALCGKLNPQQPRRLLDSIARKVEGFGRAIR